MSAGSAITGVGSMSSDQARLGTLEEALRGGARYSRGDRARQNPSQTRRKSALEFDEGNCQHCGAHVTLQFRRVWGDRDNIVWACPECHMHVDMTDGACHDPEWRPTSARCQRPTDHYDV